MKLKETENINLQYVSNLQTNTLLIKNNKDSDSELAENFKQILKVYEKKPNLEKTIIQKTV